MGFHSFFGIPTNQEIADKYNKLSIAGKLRFNKFYRKLLMAKIIIQIVILFVIVYLSF